MKYLEYPYTERDLHCTIKFNTNIFHRNHKEHDMQSDMDLVYEQIELVNKILKNYNISYEKHTLLTR